MNKSLDELYGLESVIEPGDDAAAGGLTDQVTVHCPYCGEGFAAAVDLSAGSQSYIEDCQVCCQPIEMRLTVAAGGALESLDALRIDR
ncbi:MAG: CPXCG motif-containing cysteine-rich protein [Steroidobacteraceae bacterium]